MTLKTNSPRAKPDETPATTPREELVMLVIQGKELYGLQIPQAIQAASNGSQSLQMGSLYPILHGLEKKGLVESRWGDEERSERGGARRRYYRLTGLGSTVLSDIEAFRSNLIAWQPT